MPEAALQVDLTFHLCSGIITTRRGLENDGHLGIEAPSGLQRLQTIPRDLDLTGIACLFKQLAV